MTLPSVYCEVAVSPISIFHDHLIPLPLANVAIKMDTSCESFLSQLMLSSGQASAVAQTFFPGSDFELFKNAAALEAIDVPQKWPLPPHNDSYNDDNELFVQTGDDFVEESVYWRLVLTLIVDKTVHKGFGNIKQHFVKMGQSASDGALSRREGTDIKLVAILQAKTPGSETAHPDKKVSPYLSLSWTISFTI